MNIKDVQFRMFEDVDVSITGHYAAEVLPEKVCTFDLVNHCLIIEIDGNIKQKNVISC